MSIPEGMFWRSGSEIIQNEETNGIDLLKSVLVVEGVCEGLEKKASAIPPENISANFTYIYLSYNSG